MRELVQPGSMRGLPYGLLCGTSGTKDLYMVALSLLPYLWDLDKHEQ